MTLMAADEGVLYTTLFAKYAAAFFRIARSSSSCLNLLPQLEVLLFERRALTVPAEGIRSFSPRGFDPSRHRPWRDAETLSRIRDRPPLLGNEPHRALFELFGKLSSLFHHASILSVKAEARKSLISLSTFRGKVQPGTHTQRELFTLLRDKRVQAQIIALPLQLEPFNAGTNIIEYEQKQERQAQEQRQANELLASVARESGGRVYFLNSEKELPRILPNVVRALRLPPDYSASKAQSSANAETRTETLIREAVVPDTMPLAEAKKFIARLIEARTMGQPDVLSELLADDVELISDEGRATKVQAVTQLHKRDRTVAGYKIAEPMVRAVGGSTIVTFAVSYIGHGSLPKIALYTNTLTLSKRAGRWQI